LLRWIRTHRSELIRFLPVIVCSGFTSQRLVEECRDNGANEIMVKPISAEKMAQRILYVIERPRHFVKAPSFFGPERRRREEPVVGEDRRQVKIEDIKVNNEKA
jgi:DNA-binding response OmpR family regulator